MSDPSRPITADTVVDEIERRVRARKKAQLRAVRTQFPPWYADEDGYVPSAVATAVGIAALLVFLGMVFWIPEGDFSYRLIGFLIAGALLCAGAFALAVRLQARWWAQRQVQAFRTKPARHRALRDASDEYVIRHLVLDELTDVYTVEQILALKALTPPSREAARQRGRWVPKEPTFAKLCREYLASATAPASDSSPSA